MRSKKAKPDDPCSLYWCRPDRDSDPYRRGRIGITGNERRRERDHARTYPPHEFVVLHRGPRIECARLEAHFRPVDNIGWNKHRGGGGWRGPDPEFVSVVARTTPQGNQLVFHGLTPEDAGEILALDPTGDDEEAQ